MTRALEASFGATVVRSEVESTICIHGCNCTSWPGTPLLRYAARWRRRRPFAAPPSSRCARGRDTGMSPHRSATRVAVGRSRRPQSSPSFRASRSPAAAPPSSGPHLALPQALPASATTAVFISVFLRVLMCFCPTLAVVRLRAYRRAAAASRRPRQWLAWRTAARFGDQHSLP